MGDLKRSVLIISNPKAGGGKPLKILPKVEAYLEEKGFKVKTYLTQQKNDVEGIDYSISMNLDVNALVIIGGDGTLFDVINIIPENYEIPVMVLPFGSGNDFANHLYRGASWQNILDKLDQIEVLKTDCGLCNGKRFVNGLGIGYDGWVAGKANSGMLVLPSKFKYHWALLQGLFTFRSFDTNHGKALIIAVANGSSYGGGFKIAPDAHSQDGKLNFWLIKPIKFWKRPFFLSRIKKGKHVQIPGPYHNELVSEISVKSQKLLPAHLDGEYFEAENFEVRVLENFVGFVC